MRLRELFFENLDRTGESKSAVVGYGRGMGHKGHMMLASSVLTQANESGSDPYFVISRTMGKDDPLSPEEKLQIYNKVFPNNPQVFRTATEEMPDLNRVLKKLATMGYGDVTVVVGADQVNAFQYLVRPDKSGVEPYKQFGLEHMKVIARQDTNDPSREEEGPRATPMRDVLPDPNKSEDEKFAVWRDAMSPQLSDQEVRDLMTTALQRMQDFSKPKVRAKKEKAVAEGVAETVSMQYAQKVLSHYGADYFKTTYDTLYFSKYRKQFSISRIRDDDSASAGSVNLSDLNAVVRKLRGMRVPLSPFGEGVEEGIMNFLAKPAATAISKAPSVAKSSDIPPDIMMLVQKIKNNVQLRPDELSKLKTFKATRDMYKTDKSVGEEAAGVGIVTKQNSTADVGPGTLRKNLKAFNLTK